MFFAHRLTAAGKYVYGRTLFNNALLRALTRAIPAAIRSRLVHILAHERALSHVCFTSACTRVCNSVPAYARRGRLLYPCTPFKVVTSERGVAMGNQPPSSPSVSTVLALSRTLFLSPFLPPSFCLSVSLSFSRSLFCRVVRRFAYTYVRAYIRRRTPTHW